MTDADDRFEPIASAATFEAALVLVKLALDPKAVEKNLARMKRLQHEAIEASARRAEASAALTNYELELKQRAAALDAREAELLESEQALLQDLAEREARITAPSLTLGAIR